MSLTRVALGLAASALLLSACQTTGSPSQASGQSAAPATERSVAATPYANEDKDWGVAPTSTIKADGYHAPTPLTLAGARVITTHDLAQLVAAPAKPILVDVLYDKQWVRGIPGSVWLSRAGHGSDFDDDTQERLGEHLAALTGGDRSKPVVFYCLSSECWLSHNAAVRAVRLGYRNVGWYRGGVDAWKAAGLPEDKLTQDRW